MGYTTIDELKKRVREDTLINLAFDPELGGTKAIDDETVVARLDQAIADATAEVDGYLIRFVDVPLSTPPDFIERITAVITIYNLYQSRTHSDDSNPWSDGYDNAINYLKKLTGREFAVEIDGSTVRTSGIRSNALDDSGDPVDSAFTDEMF